MRSSRHWRPQGARRGRQRATPALRPRGGMVAGRGRDRRDGHRRGHPGYTWQRHPLRCCASCWSAAPAPMRRIVTHFGALFLPSQRHRDLPRTPRLVPRSGHDHSEWPPRALAGAARPSAEPFRGHRIWSAPEPRARRRLPKSVTTYLDPSSRPLVSVATSQVTLHEVIRSIWTSPPIDAPRR
jgi:hypothetical protein